MLTQPGVYQGSPWNLVSSQQYAPPPVTWSSPASTQVFASAYQTPVAYAQPAPTYAPQQPAYDPVSAMAYTSPYQQAQANAYLFAGLLAPVNIPGLGAGIGGGYPQPQPTPPSSGSGSSNLMMLLIMLLQSDFFGGGSQGGGRTHYRGGSDVDVTTGGTKKPRITKETIEAKGSTTGARVWGDPHFVDFDKGADGKPGEYDVMGQPGKTYNILSDSNVQFNATFNPWQGKKDSTIISDVGIRVGTAETGMTDIEFKMGGSAPKVGGQTLEKGQKVTFDTGLNDDQGRAVQGSATWDGKFMTVNTGEYIMKFENAGDHLNQDVTITNLGTRSDGVDPHGLLGQNADGVVDNGKKGAGAQGEGAIAGVYTDYEVSGLFGDDFQYNKFGQQAERDIQFGFLAGGGAQATAPV